MDLREIGWGGGGGEVDSPGSRYGSMAGCHEHGDELSGSGATELITSTQYYHIRMTVL
jgi:hypothetical protein